jgi:hypothetical protein
MLVNRSKGLIVMNESLKRDLGKCGKKIVANSGGRKRVARDFSESE